MRPHLPHSLSVLLFALLAGAACYRSGVAPAAPPARKWQTFQPHYPAMFRAAHVEGVVTFAVRTDSAGQPVLATFAVSQSTNDLFMLTVRNALRTARAAALVVIRDTVLLHVFRSASDSVQACAAVGGATVVCARQPEPQRRVVY